MTYPVHDVVKPSALAGQTNGRLPSSILESVPGINGGPTLVLLRDTSARAWRALSGTAYREAGIVLKVTSTPDSYRAVEIQEQIFRARYTTTYLPGRPSRVWNHRRWYQRPGTAAAAVPGTSNHGLALAIDNDNTSPAALAWLEKNAARFGFSWEIQSEPWHIRYWAGDSLPQAVLDYEKAPSPKPSTQEEDMLPADVTGKLLTPTGKGYWLLQYDGGVTTHGDALFYGSYPALPASARQDSDGHRGFFVIEPFGDGYSITSTDGGKYDFPKK